MKPKGITEAFQHAIDGVLHAYQTQKHVRFHFFVIVPTLLAAVLFGFDRMKMVVLFFTISLVLICEMFNTALEIAVDLVTDKYHPLAKHCKDVAAGAVLIASLNAVAVGAFLFLDERKLKGDIQKLVLDSMKNSRFSDLLLILTITVTVLLTLVFIWKVWGRKGTPLHGGVVSGHSALAFFLACVIAVTASSWTATVIAVVLALLVSQSRIEGNIHTLRETIWGAILGILVTLLVFQILPRIMVNFVR
jgi:diacylglycerol kinase (ATP)